MRMTKYGPPRFVVVSITISTLEGVDTPDAQTSWLFVLVRKQKSFASPFLGTHLLDRP